MEPHRDFGVSERLCWSSRGGGDRGSGGGARLSVGFSGSLGWDGRLEMCLGRGRVGGVLGRWHRRIGGKLGGRVLGRECWVR